MADHHKLSDKINGSSESNSSNNLESLQRQLDAFLAQEKKAAAEAGRDPNERQHRLDHFINNLQHELDTSMQENPLHANLEDMIELPVMRGATKRASYSKLISRVLFAAGCVTAAILWFVWPVDQVVLPQLAQQEGVNAHQVLLAQAPLETMTTQTGIVPEAIGLVVKQAVVQKIGAKKTDTKKTGVKDTDTKKTATKKADANILSQPVLSSKRETAPQSKVSMMVRLKVTANIGNIRRAPERSGKVLFRLAHGAVVTKLAEQGGWFQVRLRNGTVAWAHHSIFQ